MESAWENHTFDIKHQVEHQERVSHHHDTDESVQYDDSDESFQHVFDHANCQQAASLPPTSISAPLLNLSELVATHTNSDVPDGFSDCPQRPPAFLG